MVALTTSKPGRDSVTNQNHDCELTHRIDTKTFRQVRNLSVVQDAGRIVLSGRSESYYVKQLATHAVLDLMPGVDIENSIDVAR